MDAPDVKLLGLLATPIIGLYAFFIKHVTSSNRHPKGDKMVYSDVCAARGKLNKQAHEYLKEGIEAAISRSDEKHQELKADMKAGFSEIKDLINGNP